MAQFFFKNLIIILIFSVFFACNEATKKEKTELIQNTKPNIDPSDSSIIIPNKVNVSKNAPLLDSAYTNPINDSSSCFYSDNMKKQRLVNVQDIDASILVSLKYSTTDNFTEKDVYGCLSDCYLQTKAAEMLANASKYLRIVNDSLRLLVYDGARPHAIQVILWESLPQYTPAKRRTFVADPAEGSIHNYGSAVDLTIAYADGTPLDMGTKYDYFGELAYPKFENRFLQNGKLSKNQIENRQLLRKVMQKAGFMPIEYEWWHFNAVSRAKAKAMYQIVD